MSLFAPCFEGFCVVVSCDLRRFGPFLLLNRVCPRLASRLHLASFPKITVQFLGMTQVHRLPYIRCVGTLGLLCSGFVNTSWGSGYYVTADCNDGAYFDDGAQYDNNQGYNAVGGEDYGYGQAQAQEGDAQYEYPQTYDQEAYEGGGYAAEDGMATTYLVDDGCDTTVVTESSMAYEQQAMSPVACGAGADPYDPRFHAGLPGSVL
jgi:hypothetical protein